MQLLVDALHCHVQIFERTFDPFGTQPAGTRENGLVPCCLLTWSAGTDMNTHIVAMEAPMPMKLPLSSCRRPRRSMRFAEMMVTPMLQHPTRTLARFALVTPACQHGHSTVRWPTYGFLQASAVA